MSTRTNVTCGLLTTLIVSLAIASAEAQNLRVEVRFSDPVDNQILSRVPADAFSSASSSILPSVLDLPAEVDAEFFLDGGLTSDRGTTTFVTTDIQRASVPFRDAEYTVMQAFNMQLLADGTLAALSWESEPLSTASVIAQVLEMNSRSQLFINGTDRSTQQPYSYFYRDSEVTITAIPEPSTLAVCLTAGLANCVRRRR